MKIVSPCISICKMDPVTGYCYGCARTMEERKQWKEETTTDKWKEDNIKDILQRMEGWQLESFKQSYSYKKSHGMSLFKQKQQKH